MTSMFAIILYIYLFSFGDQYLCNAQNNKHIDSTIIFPGKLKSIKLT